MTFLIGIVISMSQSTLTPFQVHQRTAAISQLFVSVNFSMVIASLFLYLTQVLSLSAVYATELTGLFFAVNYLFHLVSGCLNKYGLSLWQIACISLLFQLLGFMGLLCHSSRLIVVSCLSLSMGFGLITPVINLLLAQPQTSSLLQREKAYFVNYGFLSLGFLLGYSIVGLAQMTQHAAWVYDLCLVNVIVLSGLFLRLKGDFPHGDYVRSPIVSLPAIFMLFSAFLIAAYHVDLTHFQQFCSLLMLAIMIALVIVIFIGLRSQPPLIMKRFGLFLLLNAVALIYFVSFVMVSTWVMDLLNHWVDRQILGVMIPPAWVDNVAGVVAITLCPWLGCVFYRYQSCHGMITPWLKLCVGFVFAALSYAIMSLGCLWLTGTGQIALLPATVFFVCHAIAAIMICPVLYSVAADYVPEAWQPLAMGMVCCNQGLAAFIVNYLAVVAFNRSLLNGTLSLASMEGLFNHYAIVLFLTSLLCLVSTFVGDFMSKKNQFTLN